MESIRKQTLFMAVKSESTELETLCDLPPYSVLLCSVAQLHAIPHTMHISQWYIDHCVGLIIDLTRLLRPARAAARAAA